MSSATIHRMPESDPVDRMINRTVRALMAIRDMDPPAFMAAADLNKSTYYNRMKLRSGWTAAEVKRAADALGVDVATLFNGLSVAGAGFEPATSGSRAQLADVLQLTRADYELAA